MIPVAFIELESLPLTANSKVDRHALPTVDLTHQNRSNSYVAPQTPIEKQLITLWQKLLHLNPIGIHDNFFDSGGDSLLAMRLMQDISQQFQPIPLATLFQAPTIAQLASLLEQPQGRSTAHPLLIPIQPNGANPPFFCIHPIFGVVFPYTELAHCLGADQPFYGLQPVGIAGEKAPAHRVELMAAHYIQAIQTVQPQGPYLLGGWSFGGLVAFEMVRQLQTSGQSVALLAILDTVAPLPTNQPTLRDGIHLLFNAMHRSTLPGLLHYVSQFTTLHRTKILPMMRVFYANSQAAYHYRPLPYTSQITLFKTAPTSHSPGQDNSFGWHQLTTQSVQIHEISGSHLTMLNSPHVRQLATQLQRCIDSISPE